MAEDTTGRGGAVRRPVVNHQTEKVDKIHQLVIDVGKNRVAYALLSYGVNKS